MRNWIQRGGGTSALRRAMRCWISTTHCTVSPDDQFAAPERDRVLRSVRPRWSRTTATSALANIGRSVTAGSLTFGTAAASRAKAAGNIGLAFFSSQTTGIGSTRVRL